MSRKQQAEEAAMTELVKTYNGTPVDYFVMGVEWADKNPNHSIELLEHCDKSFQGDKLLQDACVKKILEKIK